MNTTATANISTMKNGKTLADLAYESKAQALELFEDMLVNGLGLDAADAAVHTANLAATNGDVVEINGDIFYYKMIEMGFEKGDRVAVTYLDGTRKEGTVLRRTAATAREVQVQFDNGIRALSPQGLEKL